MKPIREHAQFKQLMAQAELYQTLLNVIRASLPATLQPHVVGAALTPPQLIVQTDHAHYANQIRLSEQNILQNVLTQWPHLNLNQIKVKLVQLPKQQKPTMPPPKAPDPAIIQQLETLGAQLPHNRLKASLTKLVKTLEKHSH